MSIDGDFKLPGLGAISKKLFTSGEDKTVTKDLTEDFTKSSEAELISSDIDKTKVSDELTDIFSGGFTGFGKTADTSKFSGFGGFGGFGLGGFGLSKFSGFGGFGGFGLGGFGLSKFSGLGGGFAGLGGATDTSKFAGLGDTTDTSEFAGLGGGFAGLDDTTDTSKFAGLGGGFAGLGGGFDTSKLADTDKTGGIKEFLELVSAKGEITKSELEKLADKFDFGKYVDIDILAELYGIEVIDDTETKDTKTKDTTTDDTETKETTTDDTKTEETTTKKFKPVKSRKRDNK